MLAIVLAIAASTAAGVGAERRWGARTRAATRRLLDAMLFLLLPPIAFLAVASADFGGGVGVGLALAYGELAAVGTAAYLLGTRVFRLTRPQVGALMIAVVLANTGYLGLPLTAAVLGAGELGAAVLFDQLVSGPMVFVAGFAIGAALGTRAGDTPRERLRAFLVRNPVLLAVVAGFLAPEALAPEAAVEASRYVVIALLPVGFFALGVNLTAEAEEGAVRFPPPLTGPIAAAMGLRLLAAPALLALASATLVQLPDAYLLQAAMPSGINGLVVAHAYGLDLRLVAGAIAWSTAVAVAAGLAIAVT